MSGLLQKAKSLLAEKPEAQTVKLVIPKLKNTNLYYWLALIPVLILALFIRIQNLPLLKGKFLIELDSYLWFRYAKIFLEQGAIPAIDHIRYAPVGASTGGLQFFPKVMVYLYKIIHAIFPNLSQIEWHVIYPPVITIISFIFFFLFVKEIFGYKIAFFSTAFLAVMPAYIQRTSAGFADHDSIGMLLIFATFWLFALAWKSKDWRKFLPLSVAAGLTAGMTAATWGNYLFLVASVALFALLITIFTDEGKHAAIRFLPWGISYFIFGEYFMSQGVVFFAKTLPNIIVLFVLSFFAVYLILQKVPKLKAFKKIPYPVVSLLVTAGALLGINALLNLVNLKSFINVFTAGGANRVFFTVSENAQPYFLGGWWDSFGLFFLMAFLGSALLIYLLFKPKEKSNYKLHVWLVLAYAIFFLAFIFGRFSTGQNFSGIVNFFSATYLYWLFGFIAAVFLFYLFSYYKAPNYIKEIGEKWPMLLMVIWLLLTILASRLQIRTFFVTVPPIAIAAGFLVSKSIDFAKIFEKKVKWLIIIAVFAISLFAFFSAIHDSALQNKYSGSMVPGQWGDAMTWVRENTPNDAVFVHWWDYGHLTNTVGERASVTDGGHAMAWDHYVGRYLLTGKDDNSTLTFLKTHNVTYVLISEEEIMKYPAFSIIGSDENMDRFSSIGAFGLNQQKEVRNGTLFLYTGGWPLDKDYVLGKLVLSAKNAGIGGFSFVLQNNTITEPIAYVISNGQQLTLPISCVFVQGKKMNFEATANETTLNGCLMLAPYYDQNGTGNPIGGAFWLSEKTYDTNFAKLYMYNETSPYFKQVYSDDTPLGIYNGRIIGPIKIWEVQYPENVTADTDYLQQSKYG